MMTPEYQTDDELLSCLLIDREFSPHPLTHSGQELDRMGSSIIYPGKDISSAVIRVISALISGEKTSSSFFYTDIRR